jgi:hypothetical protein
MNRRRRLVLLGQDVFSWLDSQSNLLQFQLQEATGAGTALAKLNGSLNSAYDGTNVNVVTGQAGAGNIPNAYQYVPASAPYTDIYSAALASFFDPTAGTLFMFVKVTNGAVWADGTTRYILRLRTDASNQIEWFKTTTNNLVSIKYEAGGTVETVNLSGLTTTDFFMVAMTWDKAGDKMKTYLNGVQTGGDQTGLGVWVGALNSSFTLIGGDQVPASLRWDGYAALFGLSTDIWTGSQIAELYQRSGI